MRSMLSFFSFSVLIGFFFLTLPQDLRAAEKVGVMSIADWKVDVGSVPLGPPGPANASGSSPSLDASDAAASHRDRTQPVLHQIAEVRRQQGISLRSAARRMHMDVSEVKALENETTDMT